MPTSTARNPSGGFTLVEVMVAATIGALVLAGVLTANLQILRSSVRVTQYAEMSAQTRRGLDQLADDLRSASAFRWNNASDITLTIPTLAGSTRQVTYAWTSATQAFFLVPGADSAVTTGRVFLVRGIPARPDGSAGAFFTRVDRDGNTATTDLATKSVQVSLYVVRTVRTMAATTDTAVSAVFILRNKPVS